MNLRLPRLGLLFFLLATTLALLLVSQDAEARRFGGGASFGRQSSNITQQRQAATPPAATQRSAASPNTAAAGGAAKSGASRWLGPLAGIAAGLGIAALLSSLGLSGALLEFLSSALLIGLLVFGVIFIVRRLRGAGPSTATQAAGANGLAHAQNTMQRAATPPNSAATNAWHDSGAASSASAATAPAAAPDQSWFIPDDFDTPAFLNQAKQNFMRIQQLWDAGDQNSLRELLTDDLLAEITPSLPTADDGNRTEVLLLNAELMGMEAVADGHLASVRFSGMLREASGAEAKRIEEVWNLYKRDGAGWLLAGLQQL